MKRLHTQIETIHHPENGDMKKGTVHAAYWEAVQDGIMGLGETEAEAIKNLVDTLEGYQS